MATEILPVLDTVNQKVPFTLATDTLVWIHRAKDNAQVGINAKGSDGLFSDLMTMTAGTATRSGVLPAGDYEAVRISGTCGFQRA